MEINVYLIFTVLLFVLGGVFFVLKIKEENVFSNLFLSLEKAALPAGLIAGIIYTITTDVYIIYADGTNETKNVLWSCEIQDKNGFTQNLTGLGLSNKFIFNGTSHTLVEYPIYYGDDNYEGQTKAVLTILPGSITKTQNRPDFYFKEPDEIQVEKGIFELIYDFFAGSKYERWIVNYY